MRQISFYAHVLTHTKFCTCVFFKSRIEINIYSLHQHPEAPQKFPKHAFLLSDEEPRAPPDARKPSRTQTCHRPSSMTNENQTYHQMG